MRASFLAAFLFLVAAPALAGPFAGSDDFKTHLEFLGYTVEEGETSLLARHEQYYNVSVKSLGGGVLVATFFGTTDRAKSDRVGFLDFLNGMNRDAVAARYYEDEEGDVIVEGWYAGDYERSRFGVFVDRFNVISDQLGDSDVAPDYLE
jgi:hypothetical protein